MGQGRASGHFDPGADLHKRSVALAAGRGESDDVPTDRWGSSRSQADGPAQQPGADLLSPPYWQDQRPQSMSMGVVSARDRVAGETGRGGASWWPPRISTGPRRCSLTGRRAGASLCAGDRRTPPPCQPGEEAAALDIRQQHGGARAGWWATFTWKALPVAERIDDVKVNTSVQKWEIALDARSRWRRGRKYVLRERCSTAAKRSGTWPAPASPWLTSRAGRLHLRQPWKCESCGT